jgi:hypothetical protein
MQACTVMEKYLEILNIPSSAKENISRNILKLGVNRECKKICKNKKLYKKTFSTKLANSEHIITAQNQENLPNMKKSKKIYPQNLNRIPFRGLTEHSNFVF